MNRLLLIPLALFIACNSPAPTNTGEGNGGNDGKKPDTGTPPAVTRTRDSLLYTCFSGDYRYALCFEDGSGFIIGGHKPNTVARIDIPESQKKGQFTLAQNWYTDSGKLYIIGMSGYFTGDAIFSYTTRDTTYFDKWTGHWRERFLYLQVADGREDMQQVAAQIYNYQKSNCWRENF